MRGRFVPRWARSVRVLVGLGIVLGLLAAALFAPELSPHDPAAQDLMAVLQPVRLGSAWPLGTDGLGRCVLSRLLHGARVAMLVAVAAALGAMLLGGAMAYAAGYLGGWVDRVVGWLMELWLAFPPVVLSLLLMVGGGAGPGGLILAIMLVGWARFCRVLRAEVVMVARRDHVAAARLLGLSPWRTLRDEVVPATLPLLVALLVLEMGVVVGVEAVLSFVGLGVVSELATWGQMIADGRGAVYQAPASLLAPCGAIVVAVAGFNLLGDGLRRTLGLRLVDAR